MAMTSYRTLDIIHFCGLFRRRHGQSGERDEFLRQHLAGLEQERVGLQLQLTQLIQEEGRLDEQFGKLRREYRNDRITIEELRAHDADLKREHAELAAKKERLVNTLNGMEVTIQARELNGSILAGLDVWEDITMDERKTLLRHFLVRISAYRAKGGSEIECKITWRMTQASPEIKETVS